jgi:hypothetical protein
LHFVVGDEPLILLEECNADENAMTQPFFRHAIRPGESHLLASAARS